MFGAKALTETLWLVQDFKILFCPFLIFRYSVAQFIIKNNAINIIGATHLFASHYTPLLNAMLDATLDETSN